MSACAAGSSRCRDARRPARVRSGDVPSASGTRPTTSARARRAAGGCPCEGLARLGVARLVPCGAIVPRSGIAAAELVREAAAAHGQGEICAETFCQGVARAEASDVAAGGTGPARTQTAARPGGRQSQWHRRPVAVAAPGPAHGNRTRRCTTRGAVGGAAGRRWARARSGAVGDRRGAGVDTGARPVTPTAPRRPTVWAAEAPVAERLRAVASAGGLSRERATPLHPSRVRVHAVCSLPRHVLAQGHRHAPRQAGGRSERPETWCPFPVVIMTSTGAESKGSPVTIRVDDRT